MVAQDVVRGQYAAGKVGDKDVPGYRQEHGVDPNSRTETFVAMKVLIDNWRAPALFVPIASTAFRIKFRTTCCN